MCWPDRCRQHKRAATGAFCDNDEVSCTPDKLLKDVAQPAIRFAQSGLAFGKTQGSRMRRNIQSDELAAELADSAQRGASSSSAGRRKEIEEVEWKARRKRIRRTRSSSRSSKELQQRGGRRRAVSE